MLGEELGELWDGDMAFVLAVRGLEHIERGQGFGGSLGRGRRVRQNTLGLLEGGEGRGRVTRVRNKREGLGDGWVSGEATSRYTVLTRVDVSVSLVSERVSRFLGSRSLEMSVQTASALQVDPPPSCPAG